MMDRALIRRHSHSWRISSVGGRGSSRFDRPGRRVVVLPAVRVAIEVAVVVVDVTTDPVLLVAAVSEEDAPVLVDEEESALVADSEPVEEAAKQATVSTDSFASPATLALELVVEMGLAVEVVAELVDELLSAANSSGAGAITVVNSSSVS
ncbi:hypothetical protein PHYPSEUDO_000498 [Phytophthora pseudosyringae]|uniref:Uncharacterized protein n=1 Tax=Phytophthora pseudosyringae TaxID=221518 RepID=A0A8T1V6B1_9STRA|nr:hypothetical protein PHYPSEUDO_000498 [Phytophthora pseudosyringae]